MLIWVKQYLSVTNLHIQYIIFYGTEFDKKLKALLLLLLLLLLSQRYFNYIKMNMEALDDVMQCKRRKFEVVKLHNR